MQAFRRLTSNSIVRKIAGNASWLMVERLVTMGANLVVSILMARYLGPGDFGLFSYVIALVALVGFLSYLGLDSTVTRRLSEEPERTSVILGTAFFLRLGGSLAGFAIAILFAISQREDPTTAWMLAIVASGMLFQPAAVIDFFFQSKLLSRHSATARTFASLAVSAIKLALVYASASLLAFAVAAALQHLFVAIAFTLAFLRHRTDRQAWRWDGTEARHLFRISWPLALSAASALIYLKIDQVMLGEMVGTSEVGIYAVAARLSEVWWFLPTALGATFLPVLVASRREGDLVYTRRLQFMYDTIIWIGMGIAIAVSLVAYPAIRILYGEPYLPAAQMLQWHVWASPLMYAGAVLARWSVMEGHQLFTLLRNVLGAIVNVALNFLLIPRYGGVGAAVATLVSYSIASYGACLIYAPARGQFGMISKSLIAPLRAFRAVTR